MLAPPQSASALIDALDAPDRIARRFPIEDFEVFNERILDLRVLKRQLRNTSDPARRDAARDKVRAAVRATAQARGQWATNTLLRWAQTPSGFRERLVSFWADHFTAIGKSELLRYANSIFVETAIRPHVTGRFADLLIAATTHPVMMNYLDQLTSVGPNSLAAARQPRLEGINENLAREIMELHTLGVGGPYTQDDVRQLAELLTGITYRPRHGRQFIETRAEPGSETILGITYPDQPSLETIRSALTDLALHPATAAHLARKLAVHFVSDTPDPALVAHLAARYLDTGGDLMAVYAALLEHPLAWDPAPANVKPPFDFMASAFRALGLTGEPIQSMSYRQIRLRLFVPLSVMGQTWRAPSGPDGWPEEDAAWITPQSLATRLQWAMAAPQGFVPDLPDPRIFVDQALGPFASEPVRFAANAAETRSEAIGLVLSSPGFQRR
ncbi:MAG: DUF1800 domain-containing protein [Pseudomonadota bacterium]